MRKLLRDGLITALAIGPLLILVAAGPRSALATSFGRPPSAVVYSFFDRFCDGKWSSTYPGAPFPQWPATLPCPGSHGDSRGWVRRLPSNFRLEDGSLANRSLETHPAQKNDGTIWGRFLMSSAGVVLQNGDRIVAQVGFLDGAKAGQARFTVIYDADPVESGGQEELARVDDSYDGQLRNIYVDLSRFAGTRGEFMLRVDALGNFAQDQAVWVDPRLERGPTPAPTSPPSATPRPTDTPRPTATPIPTPTSTPSPTPTATSTPTATPSPTSAPTSTSEPTPTPFPTRAAPPTPVPTARPTPTPPPQKACGCFAHTILEARLTPYDGFAVGDLVAGPEAEVVTVVDEDGPGGDGEYHLYEPRGALSVPFYARFTPNDRIAIGDVWPEDAWGELVVAVDDDDRVYIHDFAGQLLQSLYARFTAYDCLAVGNVIAAPGKAPEEEEIVIATDDENRVYIYESQGGYTWFDIGEFTFDGACPLGKKCDHNDALAVGNVFGDEFDEIILLDRHGDESVLYIYNGQGILLVTTQVRYTPYDAMTTGDILGDEREEILIAVDEDHVIYVYDAVLGLLKMQYARKGTPADALAAGNVGGGPKDEILLAIDDDDKIYVYGEDCGVE